MTTVGDPGYGACYTPGIKTWTWVPVTQGPNCGPGPYDGGTLPQATRFPEVLHTHLPGTVMVHTTHPNLGCPKPADIFPYYCCCGNRFHQNPSSLVSSNPHCLWHRKAGPGACPFPRLTDADHGKRPETQTKAWARLFSHTVTCAHQRNYSQWRRGSIKH